MCFQDRLPLVWGSGPQMWGVEDERETKTDEGEVQPRRVGGAASPLRLGTGYKAGRFPRAEVGKGKDQQ